MSSIFSKLDPAGHSLVSPDYAFTEISTFKFVQPVDIEDESSPVGQLWAKTIELYSSSAGMATVGWGRHVESPQVVKLIADWKSLELRKDCISSPGFTSLLMQWQSISTSFQSDTLLVAFPSWAPSRQNIFILPAEQHFKDCINVFLTFRFPTTFDPAAIEHSEYFSDPQPKQCIWDCLWQALSRAALQSEGGWITSRSVGGWYVDDDSSSSSSNNNSEGRQARYFVGVFRFLNVETSHSFFGPVQDDERDSRAGGLLARLRDMAGAGFEIEFVKMVGRKSSEPPFVATSNPFAVGGAAFP